MKILISAFRSVFRSANYRLIGLGSFLAFFVINLVALSTPIADGAFAAELMRNVDVMVILRSVLMAILLGILTPLTVYLLRQRARAHLGASSVGLICSGVCCLAGPLCCGAISLVLGWLAGLIPATAAYEGHVFAFLGNHESLFFYTSVAFLGYALYMNSRKVSVITNSGCVSSKNMPNPQP